MRTLIRGKEKSAGRVGRFAVPSPGMRVKKRLYRFEVAKEMSILSERRGLARNK
jgi:hypothetical protein